MSKLTLSEKQQYALKLAIYVMDKNFNRYFSLNYRNAKTHECVSFGEAINILEEMLKERNK